MSRHGTSVLIWPIQLGREMFWHKMQWKEPVSQPMRPQCLSIYQYYWSLFWFLQSSRRQDLIYSLSLPFALWCLNMYMFGAKGKGGTPGGKMILSFDIGKFSLMEDVWLSAVSSFATQHKQQQHWPCHGVCSTFWISPPNSSIYDC